MPQRLFCLLVFCCVAFITDAEALTPMPPRIAVPLQAGDQPVEMRRVRIDTEISGGIAQTTVEMEFYNPNRRVLEGELQFPLLPGQEVVGFALDINGKLRDAVPVEKARGQEVFEEIVRRGVDPGLLSATQGNNYKLRVYPLFAQRSRFVRIRYVEALPLQGRQHSFRLPVEYPSVVGEYSLRITVNDPAASPRTAGSTAGLVDFTRKGAVLVSDVTRKDFRGRGMVEIQLAAPAEPRSFVQAQGDRTFFLAEVPATVRAAPRALPTRIQLLWDSSASGAERNHAKEIALLDTYFRAVREADVRLVRLRDRAETAGIFRVSRGEWQALRAALEATVYDGGTRVDDIPAGPWAEEQLLFSDGPRQFRASRVARAGGTALRGEFVATRRRSLAGARRSRERRSASSISLRTDQELPRTSCCSRKSASRVWPARASRSWSPSRPTRRAAVSSSRANWRRPTARCASHCRRLVAVNASLQVRVTMKNHEKRARGGDLCTAAHRRARSRAAVHKAEIERLGRGFGLVTRNTSLIVLEFVQDYARFRIEPPEELRAEYQALVAQGYGRAQLPDTSQQLERIVSLYREREAWWQRDYPKGPLPAPVEDRRPRDLEMLRGMAMESRGALAQRPMAAAPAAKSMADARSDLAVAEATAKRAEQSVRILPAVSSAPYMARFRNAATGQLYKIYLDERPGHALEAGFYLDVADHLYERGLTELATRVLSNLAEIDLENRHLLRLLAYRLMQAEQWALATPLFERVLELAPEEPQSWRDLASALGREGKLQRAVDLLYEVVTRPWDRRFPDVGVVAAVEMNALIAAAPEGVNTSRIDPRLLKHLPVDLRVVLAWDADQSNLDLRVQDPNGQVALHQGQPTYQGGRLSANFAGGYGPEEFVLKSAKPGTYRISVHFLWDRRQSPARCLRWPRCACSATSARRNRWNASIPSASSARASKPRWENW
jgi:tetratricopeptide (TPR) repeat protein